MRAAGRLGRQGLSEVLGKALGDLGAGHDELNRLGMPREPCGHFAEVFIGHPAQVAWPLYVGLTVAEQEFESLAVGMR